MGFRETYWRMRAWLTGWASYLKLAFKDSEKMGATDRTKEKAEKRLANEAEQLARMRFKIKMDRCRREVQAEIERSLREDEINEMLSSEVYDGFEEWLRNEKQKKRNSKA